MLKTKFTARPVRLRNLLSNETWICEDYTNVRTVEGVDFVEVHKENSPRVFWMNKTTLVKIKTESTKKG
jgi:uncharacterized cysteine cluster protein YcgN (CxxCxxCC family)